MKTLVLLSFVTFIMPSQQKRITTSVYDTESVKTDTLCASFVYVEEGNEEEQYCDSCFVVTRHVGHSERVTKWLDRNKQPINCYIKTWNTK